MQYHQERKLRLHTDPEYSSLYSWAVIEVDDHGRRVGRDQIPWNWMLHFVATSCTLSDTLEIGEIALDFLEAPSEPEATHQRRIRMPLRSGWTLAESDNHNETVFQMFGTGRTIHEISLEIHPTPVPERQQTASAWGCLSYTAEHDFLDETTDDVLIFSLFVSPDDFERYASMIAQGHVSGATVSLGSVAGFYSEWSPSISTSSIKVLAQGAEQHVECPQGVEFSPPRLGRVGRFSLTFTRNLGFK